MSDFDPAQTPEELRELMRLELTVQRLDAGGEQEIQHHIANLEGVESVTIQGETVDVYYDPLRITAKDLRELITHDGLSIKEIEADRVSPMASDSGEAS